MKITQVKKNDQWTTRAFRQLRKGDIVRYLNKEKVPIMDDKGHSMWVVASDPYIKNGKYTIDTY